MKNSLNRFDILLSTYFPVKPHVSALYRATSACVDIKVSISAPAKAAARTTRFRRTSPLPSVNGVRLWYETFVGNVLPSDDQFKLESINAAGPSELLSRVVGFPKYRSCPYLRVTLEQASKRNIPASHIKDVIFGKKFLKNFQETLYTEQTAHSIARMVHCNAIFARPKSIFDAHSTASCVCFGHMIQIGWMRDSLALGFNCVCTLTMWLMSARSRKTSMKHFSFESSTTFLWSGSNNRKEKVNSGEAQYPPLPSWAFLS